MHIEQRVTIQLVTNFTLRQRREYWRTTWSRGLVLEDFWRQAKFTIAPDGIKLELGSHDERRSYLAGFVTHKLAWEDLDDIENLRNLLADEEPIVVRTVLDKLDELREARLTMRKALALSFSQPSVIAVPG